MLIAKDLKKLKKPKVEAKACDLQSSVLTHLIRVNGYADTYQENGIKMLTQGDINDAFVHAEALPRNRAPIHLHDSLKEIPQRFVNCLNPYSYIRPHMHTAKEQWELMCWVCGNITVVFFDEVGRITKKILMNENNVRVLEVPPGQNHTLITTEKSAYLEIRNCKYHPSADRIYAAWSPAEGDEAVDGYQKQLLSAKVGDIVSIAL